MERRKVDTNLFGQPPAPASAPASAAQPPMVGAPEHREIDVIDYELAYFAQRSSTVNMLEVIDRHGDGRLLPYMQIALGDFRGSTALTIFTNTGLLLMITGTNLVNLRRHLAAWRVVYIQEGAQGPDDTAIESIRIEGSWPGTPDDDQ